MSPKFSKAIIWLFFLGTVTVLIPSCSASRRSKHTTYKKSGKSNKTNVYRHQTTAYAKKQLGVPYKYGGNTPKTGFDCSGFTKYVFAKQGINLPRVSKDQAKVGKRINLRYADTGDLVFFGKRGKVNHVAIITENKNGDIYVIHSTSSKGVKIDNISRSKYWKPRILYARNILGSNVLVRK